MLLYCTGQVTITNTTSEGQRFVQTIGFRVYLFAVGHLPILSLLTGATET